MVRVDIKRKIIYILSTITLSEVFSIIKDHDTSTEGWSIKLYNMNPIE